MGARWIRGIVLCGLLVLGGRAAAQDLGDRRGLDHVASLVRLESFDDLATPVLLSPLGVKMLIEMVE